MWAWKRLAGICFVLSEGILICACTDTRYYVVKSFNHENVKVAQKDNIWATQEKNEELFREAFEMSRDVILIFSVNKSRAFQGYARMESPPDPKTATPTWSKSLLWKSSAPFTIRWLTICEVNFGRIGHLNNKYNENQPVLIGRDGQEIDPETGAELCRVIDERAQYYENKNQHQDR
ncbi:YTH-domain-containing protein [Ascobolus immersus RN42]|uniref:YTH-domain-containing protein n=1 Tax=Ascobolus immersus RN42 TaxID=1160509 RepID=A0A3N4HDY3_ASCIM|nr:YTH-domain-containing protein [Ascobolus immersus RN42]